MPNLCADATNRATTSPVPPSHELDATPKVLYFDGNSRNPSWCFAVSMACLKPAFCSASTHWSVSRASGWKVFGSSVPSPTSRSSKVFTPKCRNAVSSFRCQASWRDDGVTVAALDVICAGVSVGETGTTSLPGAAAAGPATVMVNATAKTVTAAIRSGRLVRIIVDSPRPDDGIGRRLSVSKATKSHIRCQRCQTDAPGRLDPPPTGLASGLG